ncbi:MAG: hypothetical protein GY943_39145, partial [Chloroflexi bacterium]|nr:hypothetical protein [Chloroflexota bacterium]
MSAYHIKLINHIDEIDPIQWHIVVGGDTLQKGYRWQQYKQATQPTGWPRAWSAFVTVWSETQLVGVATAYQYPMPMPFAAPWMRRLSQIVMAPTNPINFLLLPTVAPLADETAVYHLLIKGVKKLMWRRLGLGLRMVFLDGEGERQLLNHLQHANFLLCEGIWENDLHIQWSTFAEYESSLKRDPRNQLRKQRKKARQADITITTALPTNSEQIYMLLDRVAQKNRSELLYNRNFLHHAQHILGDDHFTLFRAIHEGKTVACLLMFHDQTDAQLAAIGLD